MLNVRTYIEFFLDLGTSKVKVRLVVEELVEIGFTRSNIGSVPCTTAIHRFLGGKISIKENILWLDALFSKSVPLFTVFKFTYPVCWCFCPHIEVSIGIVPEFGRFAPLEPFTLVTGVRRNKIQYDFQPWNLIWTQLWTLVMQDM